MEIREYFIKYLKNNTNVYVAVSKLRYEMTVN